jgi:HEPN domain-containing protein
MQFARSNRKAMALLYTATEDYAGARCLLLNGLFAGLISGAQAIEKFLKAAILFAGPGENIGNTHNLPQLLIDAEKRIPNLIPLQLAPIAEHFNECYKRRYPDNPNQLTFISTGKREELDHMVIALNINLPIPRNVKMNSGLFAEITFSLNRLNEATPNEKWIKLHNSALAPHWEGIQHDYFETMKETHPHTPELHS